MLVGAFLCEKYFDRSLFAKKMSETEKMACKVTAYNKAEKLMNLKGVSYDKFIEW